MVQETRKINVKDLIGKVFYTNVKGKIVQCKFTHLVVYCNTFFRYNVPQTMYKTQRFGYVVLCADGTQLYGSYCWLPEIYETVDDCMACVNSLKAAYADEREVLESIVSRWVDCTDTFGCKGVRALSWRRNKKTLEIEERGLGSMRLDVIKDKFLDADTRFFKTREECAKNSPIEVVTF